MVYLLNKKTNQIKSELQYLKNNKRGVFFVEIVFIVLILFAIYTIINNSLNNTIEEIETSQNIEFNSLQIKEFCSQLVSSSGVPNNWNAIDNIQVVGLKSNDSNELSSQKIELLNNISDDDLNRLNIKQFHIIARNLSNSGIISRTNNSDFGISDTNFQYTRCYGYRDSGEDTIIEVRIK